MALSVDNALLVCGYRNNMIEVWDMKVGPYILSQF